MSFHKKIFITIFLIHILLGSISVFLVNRIVKEAISIGLNPKMRAELESVYDASMEEISTRKRLYDYICRDIFENIKEMRDRENIEIIKGAIMRNISNYTDLSAVEIGDKKIVLMDKSSKDGQPHYLSSINNRGVDFKCEFIVPDIVIRNQESLSRIILVQDGISKIREDLNTFYIRVYVFLFGLSFLIIMLLSFIHLRMFLSPVNDIRSGIRRIKNNIFDQPIPVRSRDEMGELALELNRLSRELKLARERESYLDRISSYQEVARRIAHEVKNPLTPIRLTFQEIEARYNGDDEKFKTLLRHSREIVEEEISTLNRIIEQFREFARMPVAVKEPVKIEEFILDVLRSNEYFRENVQLEVHLNHPDVIVEIDRLLIRKVVENLIQNAIEANARMVRISSSVVEDRYQLRVEDDGTGISEDIRDVIFEPYFTTKEYGTGLGLSITKKAVLEHRGNIFLDREYKNGTAFIIEFPIYSGS
jgi:nitrogen fixation/metabolism regulation signal transduction histidine kinase